jgi:hypothetical protein
VRIEGQDRGKEIEVFFSEALTEYDCVLTTKAADVTTLLDALGAKSDVLSTLQKQL